MNHLAMGMPSNWIYAKTEITGLMKDRDTTVTSFYMFLGISAKR